jgi:hypothetical protein
MRRFALQVKLPWERGNCKCEPLRSIHIHPILTLSSNLTCVTGAPGSDKQPQRFLTFNGDAGRCTPVRHRKLHRSSRTKERCDEKAEFASIARACAGGDDNRARDFLTCSGAYGVCAHGIRRCGEGESLSLLAGLRRYFDATSSTAHGELPRPHVPRPVAHVLTYSSCMSPCSQVVCRSTCPRSLHVPPRPPTPSQVPRAASAPCHAARYAVTFGALASGDSITPQRALGGRAVARLSHTDSARSMR